jgi:tungstate transport system substrate-binding protein
VTEPTYLYLTTKGRVTGRPREIEIWFTRYEGRYYLVAEHREKTQWVQNLRANAHVQVRVGESHFPAKARVVDARNEPGLVREIRARSEKKYGWGDGLVVELEPAGPVQGDGPMIRRLILALAGLVVLTASAPPEAARAQSTVILSTTTSTQDSGLLDVLVPMFEKTSGLTVKTISVGTGQALALASRGEADVTLAHAPALEKKYVEDGKTLNRRLVMYNDFVIVGPENDPAKIKGLSSAADALKRLVAAQARFVSRGDKSGTHVLEHSLWKAAAVTPGAPWYIESGQGMGATLGIANDRQAYTLSDRATMLAFSKRVDLKPMVEGDKLLLNIYSVMEVNPANGLKVNPAGGKAFADFMLAPETQAIIKRFGVDKFGQPLFVPIAGKKDEDF